MTLVWKERLLTWLMPMVAVCVLAFLGVMQYRWSMEVSEATTTRMRSGLQASMMNFRRDLEGQFSVLALEIQQERSASALDPALLTRKLAQWQRTTLHPSLVSNVYVWRASRPARLLHLGIPSGRLEETNWPAQIAELRRVLSARTASLSPQTVTDSRVPPSPLPFGDGPSIGGIDETIPMLAIPAVPGSAAEWLLIQLNADELRQQIFPQLAARYFGEPATSEYTVAVIANAEEHVQADYASDSHFAVSPAQSTDGTLNLFGPPSPRGSPAAPPVALFQQRDPQQSGPNRPSSTTTPWAVPTHLDPIASDGTYPDWRIVAKHRRGSVEAAVAALRRRNLALSFAVLITLAASVGLIIFTSARAMRLARLQIDFVAGVSHELRTPVAAILSIADNIAAGVISDREKFGQYGELIRNQARQLNHLVGQVLNFSAIRNKLATPSLRAFPVSEVICEALSSTAGVIRSAGIEVECALEPNTPEVYGDFSKLSQSLQNLITNAVKYSGDSKSITIKAQPSQTGTPRRQVVISVTDHGLGISQEELKRVFEAFYRSPRVAESSIHGTGLGLALSKSYVESMGGKIRAVSELNKGSTFSVLLSAATEASNDRSAVEHS